MKFMAQRFIMMKQVVNSEMKNYSFILHFDEILL